jgi:hypothetical protein
MDAARPGGSHSRQAGVLRHCHFRSGNREVCGESWLRAAARASAGRRALAWWETLALGGRHLTDDEPALSHLLANIFELLFTLFLLSELLRAWHVHSA